MKDLNEKILVEKYGLFLGEKSLQHATVVNHRRELVTYLRWCGEIRDYYRATYKTILDYIDHVKSKGNKAQTINRKLKGLSYFYELLEVKENPVKGLRVRGGVRTKLYEVLSVKVLDELYDAYDFGGLTGVRDKCMLGMVIYQGLRRGELARLELEDVDLEKGELYVKGNRKTNGRRLALSAKQIHLLSRYAYEFRARLLGNKAADHGKFYLSSGSSDFLRNSFSHLIRNIRRRNLRVKSLGQIRRSVISHWLGSENMRVVQYKSGHKYLSSTQKYRSEKELENLQDQIENLHPLN